VHPNTFYSSLFGPTKRDEIFVIISFTDQFEPRWRDVIRPCIEEDIGLRAVRVDDQASGESIVHDILDGIAHARLVIADISSQPLWSKPGTSTYRSGNVMWEVGLAHVMRVPDDVLLVKSDADTTIFDLTQFRAVEYDPRDATEARRVLSLHIRDRLRATSRTQAAYVARVAKSLNYEDLCVLFDATQTETIAHHDVNVEGVETTSFPRRKALGRLLELGLLEMRLHKGGGSSDAVEIRPRYAVTPFARQVARFLLREVGFSRDELVGGVAFKLRG
jgi:hypothetical protein